MCGIIGYIGQKPACPILISGLTRLEYRGYDSAGVALLEGTKLKVIRATGKLKNLSAKIGSESLQATMGIGHTRWATHGRPSDDNAHPHTFGGVSVVHNGIIENHLELKAELKANGHSFSSDTDSEILAHLIADSITKGASLAEAVRLTLQRMRGTYAIVALASEQPEAIVCARSSQPLVLGHGTGENFVASDVPPLLEHTREVTFLEDGDVAELGRDTIVIRAPNGNIIERPRQHIDWNVTMAEKGGHKHFMHKEIVEQPRAVADTLRGRILREAGDIHIDGWPLTDAEARALDKIWFLACGTSFHAGLVGRWLIEALAQIPVEVDLASEFRYRNPLVRKGQLAIAVSQSGETLDTLAAMREAKARGAITLAVCNAVGSALTREASVSLMTRAGPEIGVASTKAFTTQLAVFYLMAIKLGRQRGTLGTEAARLHLDHLAEAPGRIEEALREEEHIKAIAGKYVHASGFFFLGRGPMVPVALEGALKMKEISYSHAEGYAGGEMKHGPIALIDESLPVVILAPSNPKTHYDKMLGNLQEVKARGGKVIAIVDPGDSVVRELADDVIEIPSGGGSIEPMLATIPLQLLAYYVADLRGTDVDQPRNLAKSVTVE